MEGNKPTKLQEATPCGSQVSHDVLVDAPGCDAHQNESSYEGDDYNHTVRWRRHYASQLSCKVVSNLDSADARQNRKYGIAYDDAKPDDRTHWKPHTSATRMDLVYDTRGRVTTKRGVFGRPSVSRRPATDMTARIAGEICTTLEWLGADGELLGIVGSWHDTLGDAEVLSILREYNAGRRALHQPQ
jgi:hypothetical protein